MIQTLKKKLMLTKEDSVMKGNKKYLGLLVIVSLIGMLVLGGCSSQASQEAAAPATESEEAPAAEESVDSGEQITIGISLPSRN